MIAGVTQIGTLVRAWSVRPKGLIHVGAHLAEELPSYAKHGWKPRVWVEPLRKQASQIRTKIGESNQDHLFEVAVCEGTSETIELRVLNHEAASSILPLAQAKPDSYSWLSQASVISVLRMSLTQLIQELERIQIYPDLLVMDVQGAEGSVLRSGEADLKKFKWIFCEAQTIEIYENGATVDQLDEYLSTRGFKLALKIDAPDLGQADLLFINLNNYPKFVLARHLLSKFLAYAYRSQLLGKLFKVTSTAS
jgi:FkbM family methyltransferase